MHEISVGADKFGFAFGELLDDVGKNLDGVPEKAVRSACRKAAKTTREVAGGIGRRPWSERYVRGFTFKVKGYGMDVTGEVGNKSKPGLVHLLEKGHALVGGGRTRQFKHLEPGYDAGAEQFEKAAEKAVDRALRG